MKHNTGLVLLAFCLVPLGLLIVYFPHLMMSPGTPIAAHRELKADCFSCHTPFLGIPPEKCIRCHPVEEIGVKTTTGLPIANEKKNVAFHQQLIAENCVSCHSDHKGVKAFRPIRQFSHDVLDHTLQKQCDTCHSHPRDALHVQLTRNCMHCHSQNAWLPATFEHEQYFRFDRHHKTECTTCHMENDYTRYTCYGCHEHSRSKIREEHIEEGISDYENCEKCHRSSDEDDAEKLWRSQNSQDARFNHQDDHTERDDD